MPWKTAKNGIFQKEIRLQNCRHKLVELNFYIYASLSSVKFDRAVLSAKSTLKELHSTGHNV